MLDCRKDIDLTVLRMRWMNGEGRAKIGLYKTARQCVSHVYLAQ